MIDIQVKTRGDSTPQGKPRVYFSCHGKDFERYFESVSDEILRISNCAVYYYAPDDQAQSDENYELNLSQMQLFVMPVTSRLLRGGNRAMDMEFPFAIAHHIPVLPLMQESGIENLFNAKFGDLQFLDKNNRDITAISYEDKMKKFLESVLVGDELAEQIRAAFDAYIFLSYRKKDRRYAQELMRLIHKNDFCRDIAIWYDEFLTPGENFNDAIRNALEKSKLFALAVTPNLVNEINYVMTTEYPMAKETGKPILPAVLVRTDADNLKNKYPGIPDCTDAHDESALSEVLLRAVRQMAVEANDRDPRHNFFIGLAYLGGIDVEVDHEKALALITGAAEDGLTEAMEKLADMYYNGNGVARNAQKAIGWMERALNAVRICYEQTGLPEDGRRCHSIMTTLSSLWMGVGRNRAATVLLQEAEPIARQIAEQSKEARDREELLKVQTLSIAVAFFRGAYTDTKDYILSVLEQAQSYYEQYRDIFALKACHSMYILLNTIYSQESNTEQCRICAEEAIRITKLLMQEDDSSEYQTALVSNHSMLAAVCDAEEDIEGFIHYTQEAVTILEPLVKSAHNPNMNAWLDILYQQLAAAHQSMDRFDDAIRYYEKALEASAPIFEDGDQPELWLPFANRQAMLGVLCAVENQLEKAELYCLKALANLERMVQYTHSHQVWQSEIEESESAAYVSAIHSDSSISETTNGVLATQIVTLIGSSYLDICISRGKFEEGSDYITRCHETMEALADESAVTTWMFDLVEDLNLTAEDYKAHGIPAEAEYAWLLGIEVMKEMKGQTGVLRKEQLLAQFHDRVGSVYKALGLDAQYRTHHELRENHSAKEEALSLECGALMRVADEFFARAETCPDQTVDCCIKGMSILKQVAERKWDQDTFAALAERYWQLGTQLQDQTLMDKGVEVYIMLAKCYPLEPRYTQHVKELTAKYTENA